MFISEYGFLLLPLPPEVPEPSVTDSSALEFLCLPLVMEEYGSMVMKEIKLSTLAKYNVRYWPILLISPHAFKVLTIPEDEFIG